MARNNIVYRGSGVPQYAKLIIEDTYLRIVVTLLVTREVAEIIKSDLTFQMDPESSIKFSEKSHLHLYSTTRRVSLSDLPYKVGICEAMLRTMRQKILQAKIVCLKNQLNEL